jgi:predicted nucleic acid-binding protein
MALRKKRILPGRPELFWDELAILPIDAEPPLSVSQAKAVLIFSQKYRLTTYDAAYLELAKRQGLPLATLDSDLIAAALQEGVAVETQP